MTEGMQAGNIAPSLTIGIAYDDPRRAIDLLTKVLGLRVLKMWGPDEKPMFAYLAWRDSVVSIWVRPTDNPWEAVGPVSVDLHGADEQTVQDAHARAEVAEVEVVRPLAIHRNPAVPDGYLGFSLRDHEGNLWSMSTDAPTFD